MKPHIFEQGPILKGGFYNPLPTPKPALRSIPGLALFGICQSHRLALRAGAEESNALPAVIADLRREMCAPAEILILPRGETRCVDGVEIFVDASVGLKCAASFRDWIRAAKNDPSLSPVVDYAHQGEESGIAGLVVDVWYHPRRGVLAAVDWQPWAEKEILSGRCDSFSPSIFAAEDSTPLEWRVAGLRHTVGGLLDRNQMAGISALQGSVKPVTKLEELVFRACLFKRLIGQLQADGIRDAVSVLAQRSPRSYEAFTQFSELEAEHGSEFYFSHS